MNTLLKLQLNKALSIDALDKEEALFIISILNETASIDNTISAMMRYASESDDGDMPFSKKYNLREHVVYSGTILNKIRAIEISKEELEGNI